MERIGLLVGAAACAINNGSSELVNSTWNREETAVIENIFKLAPDLWASHSPPPPLKNGVGVTAAGKGSGFSLDLFVPRREITEDQSTFGEDEDILMKVINIKEGKK